MTHRRRKMVCVSAAVMCCLCWCHLADAAQEKSTDNEQQAIPFNRLGAEVDARYGGKAAGPVATKNGFNLMAKMQALEAEVGPTGLRVTSLSKSEGGGAFSIVPVAVNGMKGEGKKPKLQDSGNSVLLDRGFVAERFSASSEGIRQDFIIAGPAKKAKDLVLNIAVTGARVEKYGKDETSVMLTLPAGRRLVYNRLHVTDAQGRELSARMLVKNKAAFDIQVAAAGAAYPVTIDPTITDADWMSMNSGVPGVNGVIYAFARDSHGNIYVGGYFDVAGRISVNNIAKWNGSSWSVLGSGMDSTVYALAVDALGNLYAGGYFTTAGGTSANGIAKWNGASWSALGSGITGTNPYVRALVIDSSDNVTAGGYFTTAGGSSVNHIAKWNGTTWSALGSGITGTNPYVRALVIDSSDNVTAGGVFDTAGGVGVSNIARWNGTSWSALGSGIAGISPIGIYPVYALAVDSSNNLIAGGHFAKAGGNSANNIAKWNGSSWSPLGTGIFPDVEALAFDSHDQLIAAGRILTAGGNYASNIAKWNGTTWSALGSGTSGPVFALTLDSSDNVTAGGVFDTAGGVGVSNIGKWNGTLWSAYGSGMNAYVKAFAVDSSYNLYAGGWFKYAGGILANNIAKWDGSTWSALGSGMGGYSSSSVYALALDSSDNLTAGGYFITAGGTSANYIAKWNGTSWSAFGPGMNSAVHAIALGSSGALYAGGEFTQDGSGQDLAYIAKWNGSSWSALGSGMGGVNPVVDALAVDSSDNLIAGGEFTTAGGCTDNCTYIAKWNGSTWSALGSGMGGSSYAVYALVIDSSDNITAGGEFTTAGGNPASNIAKWNGISWSAFGDGMNSDVSALVFDSLHNLYAGGQFTTAGGNTANNIAKWNGTSWSALGSGVDTTALALAIDPSDNLYAGGEFGIAGGKISPFIAKCNLTGGTFKMSINKTGTGTGSVSSKPPGINCGAACVANFNINKNVKLNAAAASGSTFAGWSGGGCPSTGQCIITVTDNVTITAQFNTSGGGPGPGPGPGPSPATTTVKMTSTTTIKEPEPTTTTTGWCPSQKVLGKDNPDLENLRAFRDSTLAHSAVGRRVTQIYYNNAESINEALDSSPALRAAARRFLEAIAMMVEP